MSESIASLIEEAQRVANALEHFQCAGIHERNKHLGNVREVIRCYERGVTHGYRTDRPFRLSVERARDWLVETMREQLSGTNKE